MNRLIRIFLILLLFPPLLSVVAGWIGAPGFLHPEKRDLTPDMVRDADVTFREIGAKREDFDVRRMASCCAGGKFARGRLTERGCWYCTEWLTTATG
jgi:hypothetical protein